MALITERWNIALGGLVLGSLILYLKGMRIVMFQLSGFHYKFLGVQGSGSGQLKPLGRLA